jgi:hypothetical protein
MSDSIDHIYLINKILQLNDRVNILEKKMQLYENNNNKNILQTTSNNHFSNIQKYNNDETIYDPLNLQNNINANNINANNINTNNINIKNNNIHVQNNDINKIYDPLSN